LASIKTFGEALLRFSTKAGERLRSASQLDFHLGGTELNIAANLRSLGVEADWVSVIPEGPTGELVIDRARAFGLPLTHHSRANGSVGWYLLETGSRPRPDQVISRNSSVLASCEFNFDWNKIFNGSSVFHTSGVTAGISESCTREVEKAMLAAKKVGSLVSYDFNYRSSIWSLEESVKRQKPLLKNIDVLFCGAKEIETYFGGEPFRGTTLQQVVMVERDLGERNYKVEILTPDSRTQSRTIEIDNVDRIGVGDSMIAGYWAAKLTGKSLEETANFAAACGALKYSIKGDAALLKRAEVEALLNEGYKGIRR
jgi:2-dehydro-3-deoxygluconokinase